MAKIATASAGFERDRKDSRDHRREEHHKKDRREDGGEDSRDR
jgi:hypothetical protein